MKIFNAIFIMTGILIVFIITLVSEVPFFEPAMIFLLTFTALEVLSIRDDLNKR